jgi:hypothetical protein
VFDDLQRNSGKQFAPEIVNAFFRGNAKKSSPAKQREKRFRKLLGREYMEAEGLVPSSATRSTGCRRHHRSRHQWD